jgi:hypothetical protein
VATVADDDTTQRLLTELAAQLRQSRQQEELLKEALTRAIALAGGHGEA